MSSLSCRGLLAQCFVVENVHVVLNAVMYYASLIELHYVYFCPVLSDDAGSQKTVRL